MSDTTAETVAVVTIEQVQEVAADIVHADLFGSFLICGCLVAAVLFRRK